MPLLISQQAVAKAAAHRRFDYPARITAQEQGHFTIRRFAPVRTRRRGDRIADDVIRIYILVGHDDVVTPSEIEGLRTERVSTTGFRILAPARQGGFPPPHAACQSATTK